MHSYSHAEGHQKCLNMLCWSLGMYTTEQNVKRCNRGFYLYIRYLYVIHIVISFNCYRLPSVTFYLNFTGNTQYFKLRNSLIYWDSQLFATMVHGFHIVRIPFWWNICIDIILFLECERRQLNLLNPYKCQATEVVVTFIMGDQTGLACCVSKLEGN